MMKLILYVLIFSTVLITLLRPWVGVVAYYTLGLWFPQIIWPWIFGELRVTFYISLVLVTGFLFNLLTNKVKFSYLNDNINLIFLILWIFIAFSTILNPYGINETGPSYTHTIPLLINFNKIFFIYFISILLIDRKDKLHYLIMVLLVTVIYYIYWANSFYLAGHMETERLGGPGEGGVYNDENCFAMLFVFGIPYLYFMGDYYKNKILKYVLWGLIPFGWHAIFLTGSRGALLGIAAVSLFMAVKSKSKLIGWGVVTALVVAFLWQGGDYLTKRADTIVDNKDDGSAQGRLQAWNVAMRMATDYPVLGVGLGNFMIAFPDYSEETVRVTHNTFMQLISECGIITGIIYLLLFVNGYKKYNAILKQTNDPFFLAVNQSVMAGSIGFFVCSMFLNLLTYEIFFYSFIISVTLNKMISTENQIPSLSNMYLDRVSGEN